MIVPQSRLLSRLSVLRVRQLAWLPTVITLLIYVWQSVERRWIADDGLIYTRVVRQILAGHGPVFSAGERVEAATSPLWTWLLAAFGGLGADPARAAVYLGIVLSTLGLALAAYADTWTTHEGRGRIPLGLWIYAMIPVGWDFASSGLENGLSMVYIATVYALSQRLAAMAADQPDARARASLWLGFVAGLGPLVRPELAIYAFLVLGYLGLRVIQVGGMQQRRFWALVGVSGALPVGYEVFRMGYYAMLEPNTGLAKLGMGPRWAQGWHFFDNFFGFYELGVPMLIAAVALVWVVMHRSSAESRVYAVLPVIAGVLILIAVVRNGGGFMHGRMFLMPLFLLLIPVAVIRLPAKPGTLAGLTTAASAALVVGWGVLCATGLRAETIEDPYVIDERQWYVDRVDGDHPVTLADYASFPFYRDGERVIARSAGGCPPVPETTPYLILDAGYLGERGDRLCYPLNPAAVPQETRVVVQRIAIGIAGGVFYDSGVHLVDHHGLADPIAARLQGAADRRPGHTRRLSNAWFVAAYALPQPDEDPAITRSREALECPPVQDLLASVRHPLTWQRFWANIPQAFRNRTLRIPEDPDEAVAELCSHDGG